LARLLIYAQASISFPSMSANQWASRAERARQTRCFLSEILKRPKNEKPYLLVPTGCPAGGSKVPNIMKKRIDLPQRQVTTKDLPAIP
jgi:hypothetical protein